MVHNGLDTQNHLVAHKCEFLKYKDINNVALRKGQKKANGVFAQTITLYK